MTLQQSLDIAELQADIAYERYLTAFETDKHPEVLEQLNTEATVARHKYYDAYSADLAQ